MTVMPSYETTGLTYPSQMKIQDDHGPESACDAYCHT